MRNTAINPGINLTDMYMSVLASLSVSDRLDIISKLSASIKKDTPDKATKSDLMSMFSGDWSDFCEIM